MSMKNKYKQLTLSERDRICVLRNKGLSINEIAKRIGRNKGTVSRELKRNSSKKHGCYLSGRANERATQRKSLSAQRPKLKTKYIRTYVIAKLKDGWTPEIIAGRLRRKGKQYSISHEAIYQFIYSYEARKYLKLIKYLPRSHRRRYPRAHSHHHKVLHVPERVSIKERPSYIETRKTYGHWEADTAGRTRIRTHLAAMLERKSRLLLLNKLKRKTAKNFSRIINRTLCKVPKNLMKTITYDNGCENHEHQRTNKVLGTKSYFCEPYHSWEKASVEQAISLVRRFFPKTTNFGRIPVSKIKRVQRLLNNRPRKCLNYKTPLEVFNAGVALAR